MTLTSLMSADCHVVEPPDLFTSRLDKKHRLEAPRGVWGPLSDGRQGEFYSWPGVTSDRELLAVASLAAAGVPDMMEQNKSGFAGLPDYVRDPLARIKTQQTEGIEAEVLYPSWGMFLYSIQNESLRQACFSVYNDWLAEFCSADPKRLLGAAGIDIGGPDSVDGAVAELVRCARMGLRPALIPGNPGPRFNYGMRDYDPFWEAAQDLGVPISLHILCNKEVYPFTSMPAGDAGGRNYYVNTIVYTMLESLTYMIATGVFDRFPRLKVILSEGDCSWAPHFLFRFDHFQKVGDKLLPLELRPSEYFKRNCYATFQWEGSANLPHVVDLVGAARLCWGSDFPHYDSTYPNSQAIISKAMESFSAEDRRMLTGGTMAELYGL